MRKLLISIVVFLSAHLIYGQDSTESTKRIFYKVFIQLKNSPIVQQGYLKAVSDSTLTITPYPSIFSKSAAKFRAEAFSYNEISKVSVRRKGATGRAVLTGALTGVGVGVLTGLLSGNDPAGQWFRLSAGEKAIGLGLLFGISGTLIGTIVGAVSTKTFVIAADKENFQQMKIKLLRLKGWRGQAVEGSHIQILK